MMGRCVRVGFEPPAPPWKGGVLADYTTDAGEASSGWLLTLHGDLVPFEDLREDADGVGQNVCVDLDSGLAEDGRVDVVDDLDGQSELVNTTHGL